MFYDLAQLHHVGLVVDDLEESATTLRELYGVDVALFAEAHYSCVIDGVQYDTVQRMGLSAGPPFVELIRTVPDSPVWQPCPGIHHLGFVVEDLVSASAELTARGAPLWMSGGRAGVSPGSAVYHRDPLGQVIELLDPSTAERLAARRATAETGP
ncbi:VOC family protein [Nocardia carnea]|uniref:VOC family protein n=1 Tax=Nocardia carnea TaxID=37328 RepID=UPI002458C5D6|nr:VOC family protein [Nocardia carnea]